MALRVVMLTGEASGDMLAASLAGAMRELLPGVEFEGIGGERMAAAGFRLTVRTTGWSSMGHVEALGRILPLLGEGLRHAAWLRAEPADLLVLVDFGAFNLRFAQTLRALGYRRPILYFFPPGAWLDRPKQARAVARSTKALTAFARQRDYYRSLDLEIAYFGHPLVSLVAPRPARPVAPGDGGTIALLPGSRRGEIARQLGRLVAACRLLRLRRGRARFVVACADADAEQTIRAELAPLRFEGIEFVRGARPALDAADAAFIASGTAVLEAALREVPTVALYVLVEAQVAIARRVWNGPYVTLPNLLLERGVVPEFLQDDATPERLAAALDALLADPAPQLAALRQVRGVLGPADALQRCAAFAAALARGA
ncbi:MAG: lipid-A-disaccharide synthase [Candidatus Baltobacteraceae bacterium]